MPPTVVAGGGCSREQSSEAERLDRSRPAVQGMDERGVEACVIDRDPPRTRHIRRSDRDDKVQLYITETCKKVPHVPTAKELRDKDRPFAARVPKYDDVPTGKLTLIPGGVVNLSSEETLAKLIAKAADDVIQLLDQAKSRREAALAQQRQQYERQRPSRKKRPESGRCTERQPLCSNIER